MDDRDLYIGNRDHGVIVGFLRGQRPDWEGRWLTDIRQWDYDKLEADHHYLQWLFPLTTESEAVFAPVLRDFEVVELRTDPALKEQQLASFRQLLAFYGFELSGVGERVQVLPSGRYRERLVVWMTPENHNYRRISRILGSLVLAGLSIHAKAFLHALEWLWQTSEGKLAIDGVAMWYWRERTLIGTNRVEGQ